MINKRSQHGAVCIGNKMFVIGGRNNSTCEVYDSSSKKFSCIKQLELSCFESVSAVPLGGKLLVFCSGKGSINQDFLLTVLEKMSGTLNVNFLWSLKVLLVFQKFILIEN